MYGGGFLTCCSCCRLSLWLPISSTFHYLHVRLPIKLTWEELRMFSLHSESHIQALKREGGDPSVVEMICFQFLLFCLWTVRLFRCRSHICFISCLGLWTGAAEASTPCSPQRSAVGLIAASLVLLLLLSVEFTSAQYTHTALCSQQLVPSHQQRSEGRRRFPRARRGNF